jgi:hypothetical protein
MCQRTFTYRFYIIKVIFVKGNLNALVSLSG